MFGKGSLIGAFIVNISIMIKLLKLSLEHFMCVAKADLDFKQKVIILQGNNGQGKSAVQNAIAFCLTDDKRGDAAKDFVQSGFLESKIILDAEIKGEPIHFDYTISVSGGNTKLVTYKNKTYKNSEVAELLEQFDIEYYADIIMSTQGAGDSITNLKPAERKRKLQKLLQFEFEDKVKSCKNVIDELSDKIKYNRNQVQFKTDAIDVKRKEIRPELRISFKESDITTLTSEITDLTNQLSSISSFIEEKNNVTTEKSNVSSKISELERDIDKNNINIRHLTDKLNAKDSLNKEAETYTEAINLYKSKLDEVEPKLKEKTSEVEESEAKYKTINEELVKSQTELGILKSNKDKLSQGVCPTCNREYDAKDISAALEAYSNKASEVESTKIKVQEAYTKSVALRKEKSEIESDKQYLNSELNNSLIKLSSIKSQLLDDEDYASEIKAFEKDNVEAESEKTSMLSKLDELNCKIDDLNAKTSNVSDITSILTLKQNTLSSYQQTLAQNAIIIQNNQKISQSILNIESEIAETKKLIEGYEKKTEVYSEVINIFEKELPNFMIVKTCERLTQEMNDFIQVVFPKMEVRLFQNKSGVEFYYAPDKSKVKSWTKDGMLNAKMASGFEKSVLSMAFKIALCKAYDLTFAFLDEIDAFGSDENSEKLFNSLIGNDIFDQLFIITHKGAVKDAIQSIASESQVYFVNKGVFSSGV